EAGADRIHDLRKHDRNGTGPLLKRGYRRGAVGNEHLRRKADEFRRIVIGFGDAAGGETDLHPHVTAVGPAQVSHSALESTEADLPFRVIRDRDQHACAANLLALLRTRRERPRCRAANQRDEVPPFHQCLPCFNGKDTNTSAGWKAAALRHFNPVYVGAGSVTRGCKTACPLYPRGHWSAVRTLQDREGLLPSRGN